MNTKREHDTTYLKRKSENPKEYFKFLSQISGFTEDKNINLEIIDIGCATAEFLKYLNSISNRSSVNFTGLDLSQDLLDEANSRNPNCNYILGDICKIETLPKNKYDYAFASGVLMIFDEFETALKNMIHLINETGKLCIFGPFNEDIDVIVRCKKFGADFYEFGWNLHSIKSISDFLDKNYSNLNYEFIKFNLDVDVKKDENDHYRSYTVKLENKERMIITGFNQVWNLQALLINKK